MFSIFGIITTAKSGPVKCILAPVGSAAVCSKVAALLLLIYFYCCYHCLYGLCVWSLIFMQC